ncbi:tripeptidyl-peptidase 2-like [Dysidea avara]|uniref:tripeptidyl-peptidase 2-like n=1 Tax=Dysidea avara TaxID=196820 RepID=UPI00332EBE31
MTLEVKLSSSISVDLYSTMADALTSSNKWHSKKLAPRNVAYFEDKLPKNYQSGDLLKGKLTLSKADNVKKEVHYPVQYLLSEKPKRSPAAKPSSTSSSSSGSSSTQEYDKALKDLKLQWMKKKVVDISELESEFGSDLDFLMAKLSCCVEDKTCQYQPTVASLVAEVYKQVNTQDVLAYCGTKMDLSVGASDKQSQMEKTKKILMDCLLAEGVVIARELKENVTDPSSIY